MLFRSEDQLVVICSTKNPLSKKNSLSLEDLKNQNIIMREKGSGTRAILENLLITHHIPYVAKWECHSDIAIMDAIRHNIGIGVLSTRSVTDFASKKEIHAAIIEGTSLKRTFYICYNQYKPMTSQMQHLIELTMKSH